MARQRRFGARGRFTAPGARAARRTDFRRARPAHQPRRPPGAGLVRERLRRRLSNRSAGALANFWNAARRRSLRETDPWRARRMLLSTSFKVGAVCGKAAPTALSGAPSDGRPYRNPQFLSGRAARLTFDQGCGRGVAATLGGRMGKITFGCSPVRPSRKAVIVSTSSPVSWAPSWLVPMTATACRRSQALPVWK